MTTLDSRLTAAVARLNSDEVKEGSKRVRKRLMAKVSKLRKEIAKRSRGAVESAHGGGEDEPPAKRQKLSRAEEKKKRMLLNSQLSSLAKRKQLKAVQAAL